MLSKFGLKILKVAIEIEALLLLLEATATGHITKDAGGDLLSSEWGAGIAPSHDFGIGCIHWDSVMGGYEFVDFLASRKVTLTKAKLIVWKGA